MKAILFNTRNFFSEAWNGLPTSAKWMVRLTLLAIILASSLSDAGWSQAEY